MPDNYGKKKKPKPTKPKPEDVPLGTGMADRAKKLLGGRRAQIENALYRMDPPPRPPKKIKR
jgi:hypothetical protein